MQGDGEVDPTRCLFISTDIKDLDNFMAQLSQPEWRDNDFTGLTEIDKTGDENKESPDKYDGTVLAFARDSETGLRVRAL